MIMMTINTYKDLKQEAKLLHRELRNKYINKGKIYNYIDLQRYN